MVQPEGYPTKTDALERRAEKLTEDYKQALKMKKMEIKIDELEFELYVKKAERNQLSLEIFTNRKLDILV
jgi:predicted HicB family RNase H-like nuclease